ncbi:MAG: flavin reductase family protein [Verrucomicrobia bacterium]|nr:flavin reductase family protein [Verrucomicrobiota bacterium]
MTFDMTNVSGHEAYNLLIGLVAPRPIALVTSLNLEGKLNAAPFSAFNYMGTDPAIVAVGVGNRPGPAIIGKDTAQNIRNRREFVVNIVNEVIAEQMNVCAIDFPAGMNELTEAGLTTTPSSVVSTPRITESPACLECREYTTVEIGRSRIILGLVISIFVRDDLLDAAGPYVKAEKLHSIGRMNGLGNYVRTRDSFFQIHRMSYEEWLKQKWRPKNR